MFNGEKSLRLAAISGDRTSRIDFQPQLINTWLEMHQTDEPTPELKDSDIPKTGICWAPYG
jgi:hypothetical protein